MNHAKTITWAGIHEAINQLSILEFSKTPAGKALMARTRPLEHKRLIMVTTPTTDAR